MLGFALATSCWASGAGAGRAAWSPPRLVPMPREMRPRGMGASLDSTWVVVAPAPEDRRAAELVIDEARRLFGWGWTIAPDSSSSPPPGRIPRRGRDALGPSPASIELRPVAARPGEPRLYVEQGYRMEIRPRRVIIEGPSTLGRFYGVQTLRQLMRASPTGALAGLRIRDYPALEWRGISDDLARGQVSTMADFRALIRQLAFYKINLYQFTIEDLSGLKSQAGTEVHSTALTHTELLQLAVEGIRNHVVISPIFQTLGHDDRLEALGAEFQAETGGRGAPNPFGPGQPGAAKFMSRLAGRVVEATRGSYVNLGGDEWPGLMETGYPGWPNRESAALAYGGYLRAIAGDLGRRYGCRSMIYGDMILQWPAAAESLPRDLIVVDWHYDQTDSVPSLRRLAALGFRDVMVSPGIWNWTAFYPNYARAIPNIAALARAAKDANALGLILSSWGDSGAECLREYNWTGYAFAAAAAWEPLAPEPSEFLPRFVSTFYGTESSDLVEVERLLGWQDLPGVTTVGRVFHHALLVKPGTDAWRARMTSLRDDMITVEHELRRGSGTPSTNAEHAGALSHAARQFRYLAERELALDLIGRTLGDRTAAQLDDADRESIVAQLDRLHEAARALAYEYPSLWLANNRAPASPFVMNRLAGQIEMLERLRELARRGRLTTDRSYSRLQAGSY